MREWNQPPPTHSRRQITISDYLAELLDGRPERREAPRKRLSTWAAQNNLSAAQEEVKLAWWRTSRPNPLAFLAGSSLRSQETLWLHTGHTHGDLNIGNILLPIEPTLDGSRYQLIDLGSYHADGPLTRDPMHLLLSMAAHWLRTTTRIEDEGMGTDLIRALVRPSGDHAGYRLELLGHARVSQAVHDAGRTAAASLGFGDRWRLETLLSLTGCALLFADRNLRMPDEDRARAWFFTLAAVALEEYLWLTRKQPAATAPAGARPLDSTRPTREPRPVADTRKDEGEIARQSCEAIAHHLVARNRDPGLTAEQVHLLLLDFGSRASLLPSKEYSRLAVKILRAFSPADAMGDELDQRADQQADPEHEPGSRSAVPDTSAAGVRPASRRAAGSTAFESGPGVDVAILTSHPAEFDAVLQVFLGTGSTPTSMANGRWAKVSAQRSARSLSIYLACSPNRLRPGRAPAVRDVAERFDPPAFFLVGTARGHRDAEVGDVVVPRWACHYEVLESGDRVTRVPPLWTPDHIRTLLSYYRRSNTGFQEIVSAFRKMAESSQELPTLLAESRPQIILDGAVACGAPELMTEAALDDLRRRDQRLAALDTESYEFGLRNERRLWAVFRGVVSDDAVRSVSTAELFLAAGHAAACLKDFLQHEYLPE